MLGGRHRSREWLDRRFLTLRHGNGIRTAGMAMAWQSHFLAELGLIHVGLSASCVGVAGPLDPTAWGRMATEWCVSRIAGMAKTWQGHFLTEPGKFHGGWSEVGYGWTEELKSIEKVSKTTLFLTKIE